ncbi:epoxide hydrolase 2-like [Silene latifolia]|uniref:epoxide hydrolase 2-like n=1 Tax=Silene latifolia TaxID=37657 RepID=UPI003D77779D
MEKIEHKKLQVNGINMHIATIGEPTKGTILFLHGFPELWYSWRHQLLALSAAGYRAVAPDLRGFGDTDVPSSVTAYSAFHVIGDLIALLDQLGVEQVFLVGHDWGAIIAWNFVMIRGDRVKALVNLSVPFMPRNPSFKPIDGFKLAFGDDFYICRFQEPGNMEEEFSSIDTVKLMKQFLVSRDPQPPVIPKGRLVGLADKIITLPLWLTEDDVNYFAEKFKQTGFTGSLNYYRCMNLNWELTAPWTGVQIKVPTKFIIGVLDSTHNFLNIKDYLHKGGFKKDVSLLEEVVVIEGAAHFVNQERPKEISNHIQDFFAKF